MMTTIQGRIVECLPITSGVSRQTGNIWKSQQYLIAVDDDQDNIICVQVFGEEKILSYDLKKGKRIAMTIDIECKDWNGKWVTNISCKQCFVIPPRVEVPKEEKKPEITSNNFDYN